MGDSRLDEPIIEWELDEWSSDVRAELTMMLNEAGIAHRWEETVLLAESKNETEVEEILDEIDNLENEIEAQDEVDEKVLRQLLDVTQSIQRDPTDTRATAKLESILEEIDNAGAPGDIGDSAWRQIKDLASQVEEALVGASRPDEVLAMDLASRLGAVLRANL
ncbi:MAG: hypothetical protein ACKOFM_03140 [Actinomycetota bacterium]|nr:hypothetical protein [Actinomycetota bacterium]